jgi:hypothetical protein
MESLRYKDSAPDGAEEVLQPKALTFALKPGRMVLTPALIPESLLCF